MQGYRYRATIRGGGWLGQPATAQGVVPAVGLAVPSGSAFAVVKVEAQNRAGSAAAVGIVALLRDSAWAAGQWVDATTTYTDDTTDAQDAGTNDFALETNTASDGFMLSADIPFGAVSLDITTAGAAASDIHAASYWNGSAWTAIAATGFLKDIARAVVWPLGENVFFFDPPADWVVGGTGTGVPATRYNLLIQRTPTTPTVAALARRIYVGVPIFTQDALGANLRAECGYTADGVELPPEAVSLQGIFGTADEGNTFEIIYTGA